MTLQPLYPLEGTALDLPLDYVLAATPEQRREYIYDLFAALADEGEFGTMALKRKIALQTVIQDFSKLNTIAPDQYLFTDDTTLKRNVLGKGGPGSTHTDFSRLHMWKMETKIGNLAECLEFRSRTLTRPLERLFDPLNKSKECLRDHNKTAVQNALQYIQMQMGSGTAFPPIHARYFADKYLPTNRNSIIVDPCAGWGGRLVGSLLVPRSNKVTFYGIDPEERNSRAYQTLTRVVTERLKAEVWGERVANFDYMPFEDWIKTKTALDLGGGVDMVITSPPYGCSAEIYNPENPEQSAIRYPTYQKWHDGFLKPLIEGSYRLLKPGGHLVLNIADVQDAPNLENDACNMASSTGFQLEDTYQLALSRSPGNRKAGRKVRTVPVDGVEYKREPVFCFLRPNDDL